MTFNNIQPPSVTTLVEQFKLLACDDVQIIVCPYLGTYPVLAEHSRHRELRFVNVEQHLTFEQRQKLVARMVNVCGRVCVGKSTVAEVLSRVFRSVDILPEAKVEEERPLRRGEERGRHVVLYQNRKTFLQAVRDDQFFLAYRFRRSSESEWQHAGIRWAELARVARPDNTVRYLTIVHGLGWAIMRTILPGLHGFVVVATAEDYEFYKQQRGVTPQNGEGKNLYGFAYRDEAVHIPAALLPNPRVKCPRRTLALRYRDEAVYDYLTRILYPTDYFWSIERGHRSDEDVDHERVRAVLEGRIPPRPRPGPRPSRP